jgi:hypothetical protein
MDKQVQNLLKQIEDSKQYENKLTTELEKVSNNTSLTLFNIREQERMLGETFNSLVDDSLGHLNKRYLIGCSNELIRYREKFENDSKDYQARLSSLLNEIRKVREKLEAEVKDMLHPIYLVEGIVSNNYNTKKYKQIVGYFTTYMEAYKAANSCKNVKCVQIIAIGKHEVQNERIKIDGPINDRGYCSD